MTYKLPTHISKINQKTSPSTIVDIKTKPLPIDEELNANESFCRLESTVVVVVVVVAN